MRVCECFVCVYVCRTILRHGHAGQLHGGPMLIYVCSEWLSISKHYTIINYEYLLLCYKWTSILASDVVSQSSLQTDVHVCVRISSAT